jgi:hypothetical protein
LDIKINQRIEEAEDLKRRAFSIGSPEIKADAVQSSPSADPLADAVSRYVDLENKINAMIDKFVAMKDKLIGEIQQVEDPRYCTVLYLRYVKYMTMTEISEYMNYDYYYTCKIHGQALLAFERIKNTNNDK